MPMIKIFYFRSLYSQSISSISVSKFSKYLLDRGYKTEIKLLSNTDYGINFNALKNIKSNDIIIYKTNFKDFNYGIELFKNILANKQNKFILTGPFAILNKNRITEKYPFISDIIDIQTTCNLNSMFPVIGNIILKDSVIADYDREIESKEKGYYVNLESSTGCINHCAFCHINLTNQPYDKRNINQVVDEIVQLYNKYHKRYFIFNDSMFYKGKKDDERIKEFCSLIKSSGIKIYFYVYLAMIPRIPENLLLQLKEIGLIRVFFGIESISDEFQINNKKNVSSKLAKDFIQYLQKHEISYHIGFILFYPELTFGGLIQNLNFLFDIRKLFRIGVIIEQMRILPN